MNYLKKIYLLMTNKRLLISLCFTIAFIGNVMANHGTHYGKAVAESGGNGRVYVSPSSIAPSSSSSNWENKRSEYAFNCEGNGSGDQKLLYWHALANAGYEFEGWKSSNGSVFESTNNPYPVNASASSENSNSPTETKKIAHFIPYYLFEAFTCTSGDEMGTAIVSLTNSKVRINANSAQTTATFTATPSTDYEFKYWVDNATGAEEGIGQQSYTINLTNSTKGSTVSKTLCAIFAKFKPSTTTINFGEIAYNPSASYTQSVTISAHNVGTWSNLSGLTSDGVFSANMSGALNNESLHTCTITVTLTPKAVGNITEHLYITTSRGGTIDVTISASISGTPKYTWNEEIWDVDGNQIKTIYVEDLTLTDIVGSTSNGAWTYSVTGTPSGVNNEGATVPTFTSNQVTCGQAGVYTLSVSQAAEIGGYKAGSDSRTLTINKRNNVIKVEGSPAYSTSMYYASTQNVTISSDNNGGSAPAFAVSASSDADVATYSGAGASGTITTYHKTGSASWTVTQAEDYKYQAGSATMSVNVDALVEEECNVQTYSDVSITTHITSTSGEQSSEFMVPSNYKNLCFKISHNSVLGVEALDNVYVEFSQDNGSSWTKESKINGWSTSWSSEKSFSIPYGVTHFRFNARPGSTYSHYFKDIHITRKTYLNTTEPSLNFGTILLDSTTSKTFNVEWSSSNTGDIHIVSSDPMHFSVSQGSSPITNTDCASGTRIVTITYHGRDANPHSGKIIIYDKGRVIEVPVTGTTRERYNLIIEGSDKAMKVDRDLKANFVFRYDEGVNEKPSRPVDGDAPGFNPLADGNHFYYTISHDLTGNATTAGSPDGTKVVSYDPVNDKLTALNAGTAKIIFHEVGSDEVNARADVSFNITVTKHDPTFTWTLDNAEWASKYKFSYYFSSDNEATPWSAVSNTDIAVYRSSTDSIYTNYRSGAATFTVTQEENFKYNRKDSTVTTNVQHGVESTCYLYESPENQEIKVWDFVQATWSDTAVAGKVIFEAMRGPGDFLGIVGLKVFQTLNGTNSQVGDMITNQVRDSYKSYERELDDLATGLTFDNWFDSPIGDGIDFTNRVKNVKVTRKPWIKASEKEITLPTIGKLGYSEKTVLLSWSGVDSLRIEQKNNNSHFSVIPDEHFVQILCGRTSSSVLTFSYHSDTPVANETDTFVIYDHAESLEIIVHGTTEDKEMQEIVWNQSFNPILAPEGTINADSLLTAYAVNRSGNETHLQITYTIGNTSIATIENGNHLHITSVGRTTITATVAGDATYSTATKTIILNVLDGNGCGSYAYSNSNEVSLFTITSDDAMAVTRPAEDLYFEAKRDFASIQKYVKLRYKVAGDDDWKYNDENGVELKADELPWRDYQLYGPYRLPENTVGIQFYTELGATLSKHVRNVYITQRSYLRKDKDELSATILVNNSTKIGEFIVEYSDKPTLIINNKCSNVELHVDNPAPNTCGEAGMYKYSVSCLSDTIGVIKDTVTITSHLEGDTLLIPITITVGVDGNFIFDNGFDHDTTHTDWNVSQYWRKDNVYNHNSIPTMASLTTIEGPTIIDYDAYTYQLTITNTGSVTIAPSGSLKVGAGGIIGANVSNLVLEADTTGKTGVLRLYPGIPDEKLPDALVQIYTKAFWDRENKQKAVWQYIGTPVRNPDTNEHIFYQCWLYQYYQSLDKWKNAGNWGHMNPFQAYALTRDSKSSGPLTGFGGQLNTLSIQNVDLTYIDKDHCENHLANSWTAPIYLKQFKPSDFQNVDPIIYCYTIEGKGLAKEIAVYTSDYTDNDILPAMQGFFVKAKTNENPQLLLDYERLVWKTETSKNAPLRAPSRMNEEESDLSARICIQMTSADMVIDRIYLLEKDDEGFSPDYEVGYDAPKYFVDGLPCIYTYETSGPHLAVSATDDVVGTYLAINTNASQNYTLTFSKVIGEGLGLRDLVTNTIVPISEGMQYSFTAPANSSPMLRFVVVEHEETPEWNNNNGGTSLENVGGEFKIWQSGEILSVIGAGSHASLRLYDAAGKLILSEFFNEATAINLNALPTGVYMVQVNDKTEKVLR